MGPTANDSWSKYDMTSGHFIGYSRTHERERGHPRAHTPTCEHAQVHAACDPRRNAVGRDRIPDGPERPALPLAHQSASRHPVREMRISNSGIDSAYCKYGYESRNMRMTMLMLQIRVREMRITMLINEGSRLAKCGARTTASRSTRSAKWERAPVGIVLSGNGSKWD